jgi:broad specificity phosphatase PhoE
MRSVVILCRHGNTFEKGDKVVMVGAREDLPLTAHGIQQARDVGVALAALKIAPSRIISGPLQRTKVFAEQVRSETKTVDMIEIDERLIEFDYGAWSGLSNDEIVTLSGQRALDAWQERSERPSGVTFEPSAERARADAADLMRELESLSGVALVVTSNGRLREFGQLLSGASPLPSFKVKTGHACVVIRDGDRWKVVGWDLNPDQLQAIVAQR